jgi:hypothetical protein
MMPGAKANVDGHASSNGRTKTPTDVAAPQAFESTEIPLPLAASCGCVWPAGEIYV